MAWILEHHLHPAYPRLSIQLRKRSRYYQALTFLDGRKIQQSLKTDSLPTAFKLAEDWYRRQCRASVQFGHQHPVARLTADPTLIELFRAYLADREPRKRPETEKRWGPIALYWRALRVREITPQTFKAFYQWRRKRLRTITPHTLHKDVVLIRQILKHAREDGHIEVLPLIPSVGTITSNPRPWLSRAEWDHLFDIAITRILEAPTSRVHRQRQDLCDFLMFMLESCLRVGELRSLTVGQCRVKDEEKPYLLIDVYGKTGHRTAVAGGFALAVFERRRPGLKPGDRLWPHSQRDAFRALLIAAKLRTDAFGMTRNLKSIRATAISFKILAGAPSPNLLMIARNAGTSVSMIDNFYARRLSAELGAAELTKSTV